MAETLLALFARFQLAAQAQADQQADKDTDAEANCDRFGGTPPHHLFGVFIAVAEGLDRLAASLLNFLRRVFDVLAGVFDRRAKTSLARKLVLALGAWRKA